MGLATTAAAALLAAAAAIAVPQRYSSSATAAADPQQQQQQKDQQQQPEQNLMAHAGCTAASCNFYVLCDETTVPVYTRNMTNGSQLPYTHCGQVDAAPAIPAALFKPENANKLALYIKFTEDIQIADPFCSGVKTATSMPKLGSCASRGYKYKHVNEPGRRIEWAGEEHGSNPSFEPSVAFEKACLSGCGCCANTTTQANPGRLPECSTQQRVPVCGDEIKPGVPEWCGVCGPTLNADRDVDFYFSTRVENVCQPRKSADKVLCAEAKGPLACLSKIGRCVWGAPDSDGQCVLGDSMVCKRGNSTGVFCGATCLPSFDCALCRSQTRQPSGPIPQLVFEVCCDGCEYCVATGNGTYTDENDCSTFGDGIHDIPCKWEKNK